MLHCYCIHGTFRKKHNSSFDSSDCKFVVYCNQESILIYTLDIIHIIKCKLLACRMILCNFLSLYKAFKVFYSGRKLQFLNWCGMWLESLNGMRTGVMTGLCTVDGFICESHLFFHSGCLHVVIIVHC